MWTVRRPLALSAAPLDRWFKRFHPGTMRHGALARSGRCGDVPMRCPTDRSGGAASRASMARLYREMTWGDMTMRIGGVFDGVDEITGRAVVAPDHVRLDPAERVRVGAYLRAGTEVMSTTATDVDQVEPDRGEVVPMGFRTDGEWVWSDEVPYYVETYGLAPEPDLYRHIVNHGYRPPVPDADAATRAQRALEVPAGAAPPELPDSG